jgi:transposase
MTTKPTTQILDHLGLVAGMFDELGIAEVIDQYIPQDHEKRHISVGQAVKAMVLNGLGFVNQNLYLIPHFFQNKPIDRLMGEGITAEQLNDDVLGRALDRLFERDVTCLYHQIGCKAARILGLQRNFCHLDSSSFHTDGKHAHSGEEGTIFITQGHSRDHRPELNQVVLNLIVENEAGIPLLMSPASGNSEDKKGFRALIHGHIHQLKEAHAIDYIVADSALYCQETIEGLSEYSVHWITRVPETINEVKKAIKEASSFKCLQKGYHYRAVTSTYAGVSQRWLIIQSDAAKKRNLASQIKKFSERTLIESKAFNGLCRKEFACEIDARNALKELEKKLRYTSLHEVQIVERPGYKKSGRPVKGAEPDKNLYFIEGASASITAVFNEKLHEKSCFVLATNQLNKEELSDEEILIRYKDQSKVEKGFRFLKDPMFLSSALFLKNTKRITALLMVMTICLLVYAALEMRIRTLLKTVVAFFPSQTGKKIQNPSVRWVFSYFHGIHILMAHGVEKMILNLNENHVLLVELMGKRYEKYYA